MKIILIGSHGQLGACLMDKLADASWQLIGFSKAELDITDTSAVKSTIIARRPDVIINAAAYTAVEAAETNIAAADAVNHIAVENLAAVARDLDALLIHISTDYVFGGEKQHSYSETDLPNPLNVYGQTKLAGERAIAAQMSKYYILRTSWLFGARGNNFYTKMSDMFKTTDKVNVVNDQVGGPTYVDDLAQVIKSMLQRIEEKNPLPWGIYHYAGYPFVSWYEFACCIQLSLSGQTQCKLHPISSDFSPYRAPRPINSSLDCSKLTRLLGTSPSDWRRAIRVLNQPR